MLEFYPAIKAVHVGCVIASGSLFTFRGLLALRGLPVANHAAFRRLSSGIDTVLLAAAVMLAVMLRQYPFVHGWLTVKVMLLVAYIVLGVFALRRARTAQGRLLCFLGALATLLAIVSVALAHDPFGPFGPMLRGR